MSSNLDLIKKVADDLLQYLAENADESQPTVRFTSETELANAFKEAGASLDLADEAVAVDHEILHKAVRLVQHYSVRTGSTNFNNQLYGTPDVVGVAGDWVSTALNTNTHTYEVSPVFTTMERSVLSKFARKIGGRYVQGANGEGGHDGLTLPGGSVCNQYAMHLARFKAVPEIKQKGMSVLLGKKLVAFTSADSHYSYLKAVNMLGLGTDNLVKVKCDGLTGAMNAAALKVAVEECLAGGDVPFFVGTTAGTTVLGGFDPFDAIADICEEYKLWMHVDASWGGGALFSRDAKTLDLMKGANRSDSMGWNPHKIVGAPLQCSLFLISYDETTHDFFKRANGASASYLFQPDKNHSNLDMGDKTLHCGRKGDALKMWLMWKALGDEGLGKRVDHLIGLIGHMSKEIGTIVDDKGRYCFVQVAPTQYANLCFYAVPPSLRVEPGSEGKRFDPYIATKSQMEYIKTIAPKLKDRMQKKGLALIGFQPIGDSLPNCWRMVTAGAKEVNFTTETIDRILSSLVELNADL
uniref:Cysteine sulfinic acid decarboxylase n=1 Tax=Sphaeroforma arctica JP610 TaxID=667725 RepID=A0A0L0FWH7_9EUKA|nr:hypothetical protein SARC_06468 [Sphaeroforma arctica JP610]KNC81185.1 hypothetical protein SARC_06468 [Sphaeroforma arctica JP610]|eukprot:XP_014155087.1 hypothetical protein SARC_06468 [Sphaeroforma arctica JP610]